MKKYNVVFFLFSLFVLTSCLEKEEVFDIDLVASAIEFTASGINPMMQDFEGTATIRGVVTNNGGDDFVSGSGQQSIRLYETNPGGLATIVATGTFERLDAGATLRLEYTRTWNISSPAEGEFPPEYELEISFDPDIFIDDTTQNDDNDLDNNTLIESGQQINDLF